MGTDNTPPRCNIDPTSTASATELLGLAALEFGFELLVGP